MAPGVSRVRWMIDDGAKNVGPFLRDEARPLNGLKLIVGCGYLGQFVARRWMADGARVVGVTRTAEKIDGFETIAADVTRPETLAGLPEAETVLYAVGHDPQSGNTREQVYAEGLRAVLDVLSPRTKRIITISSTGVYGQTDGGWVDESSPCRPTREAGRAFLAAERVLAEHPLGDRGIVLRLAGIYGPGRLPRKADILAGRPLRVPLQSYLNLIHVEDAARVVLAAEARANPPRTYLVADSHPAERQPFFDYLAELLGAPRPQYEQPSPEALAKHHASSNKRIRNQRMLDELSIQLNYPTYREGLAQVVASL